MEKPFAVALLAVVTSVTAGGAPAQEKFLVQLPIKDRGRYEFQWQGNPRLYQTSPGNDVRGTVAGHFNNVNINFFSMNLVWRSGNMDN